ncbi:MAG: ATP-NAD kinase family protein [Methanospirillum sp.]
MLAFRTIGLVVNPLAGLGGRVGLKGTDGCADRARALGAEPLAPARAAEALAPLAGHELRFVTAAGEMGAAPLVAAGIADADCVYLPPVPSTAADTRAACQAFLDAGVDLVLFCGGDGTARDVADAVGTAVPILGIPAGVKMYSSVFALDPGAVARILLADGPVRCADAEVIDVDEAAYRVNDFRTVLHAIVRTPSAPGLVQAAKQVIEEADEDRARAAIGRFIADAMRPGVLYILGPGTTTGAVAGALGVEGTLLGFDAVLDDRLVGTDLAERDLLALLDSGREARLVLSVIGAQGFVLGRGTQVCTPAVIRRIGPGNLIVVGTPGKLARTPRLHVDTGDPELDRTFGPHLQVVTGYGTAQRKRVGTDTFV